MINILEYPDMIIWDKKIGADHECDSRKILFQDGEVLIKAPEGVSFVTLRWLGNIPLNGKVFGDVFERTYADLEWRGILPERVMPWYCAIYDGKLCEGFGVKVRPNALCFWQIDELGVSLTLDLRSGTQPTRIVKDFAPQNLCILSRMNLPFCL